MAGFDCPPDAEWLAWLQHTLDIERLELLTAHIDACAACQNRLAQLDAAEERRAAAAGDDLRADLRARPRASLPRRG